ncbi:uncharacterized protein LOC128997965 isoform X2 [Macrosteles quadrilineatus]|uniref:uncharacterized protein LOC128984751 isoform X2 n=1 Tax=Macrosteles quadrilineatus TaxID=74068 RepID=UPI0023E1850E|nr:uncharacterized protein LOC128984751 isoform X2 [Macrosteles quadrilineatus]XP_054279811.1 uncharacterized protein LOC128997965 isoform X2 [Macrosteles quadrilineatus]
MPLTTRTVTYFWCLLFVGAFGEKPSYHGERKCELRVINFLQCKENEACVSVDTRTICQCRTDYERNDNGVCQPVPKPSNPISSPNTADKSSSGGFGFKLILWLIMPVLLAVSIGGIVYTGRQKMWLNRLYRMRSTRPV